MKRLLYSLATGLVSLICFGTVLGVSWVLSTMPNWVAWTILASGLFIGGTLVAYFGFSRDLQGDKNG